MSKLFPLSLVLLLVFSFSISTSAQFDDLYYDSDDYESNVEELDFNVPNEYDSEEYSEQSDYSFDGDEYDEYIEYYGNNYELDGYQYTNRLTRYRLSVFTSSYYGVPYWGTGVGFDSYFLSRYASDPFFAYYVRQQLIFGPSYSRLRSVYGPYADPFSPFYNPFRRSGFSVGLGIGFGSPGYYGSFNRGLGGYYGGFGGAGYYCPPYLGNRAVIINNNYLNNVRTVNQSRRSGTLTTSTRSNNRVKTASVVNNSRRVSVRNPSNTADRTVSVRKNRSPKNSIGTSSSRRSSRSINSSRTNSRSSFNTNRSRRSNNNRSMNTSRSKSSSRSIKSSNRSSTRSVGTSSSRSTRSSSPRSTSSSRKSSRK